MRIRLRAFGYTFASLTVDIGPALELLDDEETPTGITGGPAVYMERDPYPPDPAERHNHEYDRFGFNRSKKSGPTPEH